MALVVQSSAADVPAVVRPLAESLRLALESCAEQFGGNYGKTFDRFGIDHGSSDSEMKMITDHFYELQNDYELTVVGLREFNWIVCWDI